MRHETSHFQFGYVQGYMDWRPTTRDGEPAVEWTWEGTDGADLTEMTGRGWTKLDDEQRHGMIVIHWGGESGFVAKRAKATKSAREEEAGDERMANCWRPKPLDTRTHRRPRCA